jgi:hypothetical protein
MHFLESAVLIASVAFAGAIVVWRFIPPLGPAPTVDSGSAGRGDLRASSNLRPGYLPRDPTFDPSGFMDLVRSLPRWDSITTSRQPEARARD